MSGREQAVAGPPRQDNAKEPAEDGPGCRDAAYWSIQGLWRLPVFRHDLERNQLDRDQNPDRYNDNVVQIAENRDEIRDQVNGRKRITGNAHGQRVGIPRHARITSGEIDRVHVSFDTASPLSRSLDHRVLAPYTILRAAMTMAVTLNMRPHAHKITIKIVRTAG